MKKSYTTRNRPARVQTAVHQTLPLLYCGPLVPAQQQCQLVAYPIRSVNGTFQITHQRILNIYFTVHQSTRQRKSPSGLVLLSQYSDWIRAGRSGDRIPVGARYSTPVQTGPGAHPSFCTMGTGSFPGVKCGRDVLLTTHVLLVPGSRKSRAIPLLALQAVRPVESLSACTRVHFT